MDEEVRRKITRARAQLIMHKSFWGYLACYLEPVEDRNLLIKTAGVDGKYLYYDPDYIRELDMEYLQGLIGHEVYHAGFGHIWRRGARDPIRWNIAADIVANTHLLAEGFKLPPGGVMENASRDDIEEVRKLSVEEAYEKIEVKVAKGGKGKGKGDISLPGGDAALDGDLLDDHDVWDRAGDEKGELEKSQAKKELAQKWREYVSRARQIVKSQGKGMGSMDEMVDELLEPRLPWQELLRNFVLSTIRSDYRLIPPAKKHIWRGIYLPSTYGETIEIAVAIDTSGSMSDEEVIGAVSEVCGICEQFQDYTIHYYQCDYGLQLYEEIRPYTEIPKKIRGRGGTSFVPVFRDIAEKGLNISCLVYFTDLMGDFPEQTPIEYSVLWIASGGKEEAPFGTVVKYNRKY